MYQPLNVELASRIGIRTALVAQCLWDLCEGRCPSETSVFDGRRWLRMGQHSLTVIMPYLTLHTARFELERLVALGAIRSRQLSDDRFDHTNWYSFTEFGCDLMVSTECCENAALWE